MKPKYKRVLLKLSGESLAGEMKHGIDFETVLKICKPIKECVDAGVEVGIVVGGGNFWRGRSSGEMDRTRADHMGMQQQSMHSVFVMHSNSLELMFVYRQLSLCIRLQSRTSEIKQFFTFRRAE
jgi:uridylate kinase